MPYNPTNSVELCKHNLRFTEKKFALHGARSRATTVSRIAFARRKSFSTRFSSRAFQHPKIVSYRASITTRGV